MRKSFRIVLFLASAGSAAAAENTWQAPAGSSAELWSTTVNWSDGLPTPDDDLVFPMGTNLQALLDVDATVQSLKFQNGFTILSPDSKNLSLTGGVVTEFGDSAISAPLVLEAGSHTFTLATPLSLSRVSGPGGITKTGIEKLTLFGTTANTYMGDTVIQQGQVDLEKPAGTIAIPGNLTIGQSGGNSLATAFLAFADQIADTADVTIFECGTLDLNSVAETVNALDMTGGRIKMIRKAIVGTLTLGGDVTASSGSSSLDSCAKTASIEGKLALGAATRTFTVNDGPEANDLSIGAIISGGVGVGLTKAGPGTLQVAGAAANIYTGDTTVNEGLLLLAKTAAIAIPGKLFVGDGTGGADADVVRANGGGQIADASEVNVSSSGLLDLNGFPEILGTLSLTAGHVQTGAGELSVTALNIAADAGLSKLEGKMLLGTPLTVTVDDGSQEVDFELSAVLRGSGSLTKTGAGRLALGGGDNIYSGTTTVSAGVLRIVNATALGSIAGGTSVSDGAALETEGDFTVVEEALTLNGSGISGAGALIVPGTVIWTGNLTLATASTVDVAGTLTVSRNQKITGPGGLTKTGAGTLVIPLNNDYTGVTTVSAGTISIKQPLSLGTAAGGITVASGAALELDGEFAVTEEPLSIGGSGIGGAGALLAKGGESRWLGPMTLASDTTVSNEDPNDPNDLLELGGAISGSGGLIKNGPGILLLGGAVTNTYAGLTTLNSGTLQLNKFKNLDPNAVGVPGDLIIGDGIGSDLVLLLPSRREQIADTSIVTLNSSGTLDLTNLISNGFFETICRLIDNGGAVINEARLMQTLLCAGPVPQSTKTGRGLLVLGLMFGAGLALRRAGERHERGRSHEARFLATPADPARMQ